MLRTKPRLSYCGLTLILSNPSRFDKVSLLTSTGGRLLNDFCLRPDYNTMQCDIRLADDNSPLLANTRCIVLFGEYAMHKWLPETKQNTLNEMRGSVFSIVSIKAIPTFIPQDAADIRAHEQSLNPLAHDYVIDGSDSEDDEDEGDVKRLGRTKRSNYAFWIREDIKKAKTILSLSGQLPALAFPKPNYILHPSSDDVIKVLNENKGQYLYFDMETDREEHNMQCFSFTFDGKNIFGVPTLDYNYRPAYSSLPYIIRALAVAIKHNTIVSHNGASFDFFVLGYKYKIPVVSCYDTLLAHHRCWPDVEKSLGHCVSHLTWERFHKDEDSQGYHTKEQMNARLLYCCKDTYTMFLVHKAIEQYAKTIPGLQHSIDTVNTAIRPYLTTMLQGIKIDFQSCKKTMDKNDRLMTQYIRIINLLIGDVGLQQIKCRMKGKPKSVAGSTTQQVIYFHDLLGYPVVARSKDTGKPSLGKKAIYRLALKHDNPVIKFILTYRKLQKEYGALNIIPWLMDDGSHGTCKLSDIIYDNIITQPTNTSKEQTFPIPV